MNIDGNDTSWNVHGTVDRVSTALECTFVLFRVTLDHSALCFLQ